MQPAGLGLPDEQVMLDVGREDAAVLAERNRLYPAVAGWLGEMVQCQVAANRDDGNQQQRIATT